MKKLALTNLMLLMAIKSVSACSYAPGNKPVSVFDGREIYFWILFVGTFVLLVPIVILYFLRKRHGLWTIITGMVGLILYLPAIAMGAYLSICGNGLPVAAVIIAGFFFMFILFTFQLSSWISERKTSIKLQ